MARHYDEIDPFYRNLWGEHLHHGLWEDGRSGDAGEAAKALVERVARTAGIRRGDRVCDVGCGYGATALLLARRYGADVIGLTLSTVQHDLGRRRIGHGDRVSLLLRDWADNRLPDGRFDAVIAIESTEHMDNRELAFAEAARVLRPGGRLVLCAWLAADGCRDWHRYRLLRPICHEGRLAGLGTALEHRRWLGRAGFGRITHTDLTLQVRPTWNLCLRRTLGALASPAGWRFLLDHRNRNRRFALAVARIWLAYHVGALRYGLFSAVRHG